MKVIRAQAMGMCFGVKDAIQTAMNVNEPEKTVIYGQLVHNSEVLKKFRERGFLMALESDRSIPSKASQIVITAHGISDKERSRLIATGKTLVDTTCPLVRRVHEIAKEFQKRGYFIVVIGKKDHVEVMGLVGDLRHYSIVEKPEDVEIYTVDRIG